MFICMLGNAAFTGETAEAAYSAYLNSDVDVADIVGPNYLDWYVGEKATASVAVVVAAKPVQQTKLPKRGK